MKFWSRMKLWQKILLVVAVLVVLGSIGTASNGDGKFQVSDPAPADPQSGDEAEGSEGSEDDEVSAGVSEGRECDEYDDVTSGRPLCEFADAASYPYRYASRGTSTPCCRRCKTSRRGPRRRT